MPEQRTDKKRCFIITPIGNDNDSIRRHIDGIIDAAIKPALEPDYEVVAAHKITETGTITKQIIKEIYQDELAIANLTGNNPNVMYELAVRYCLGKPVLTIAEKGTSLPFDVMPERTIFYINDPQGSLDLKEAIKSYDPSYYIMKMELAKGKRKRDGPVRVLYRPHRSNVSQERNKKESRQLTLETLFHQVEHCPQQSNL